MDWMQLSLQTDQANADLVSEVLMGLDSMSITYLDTHDDAIYEPPVGETPLWQHVTITALFDMGVDQGHVSKTLLDLCNTKILNFEVLADRVWEDECKKDFHAMQFGNRIWICPSWEAQSELPSDAIVIDMDPGLAFGTGTHQTTDLCLQYLDNYPLQDLTVIDYGSGTGILAIAVAKLGATSVVAIDNDPQAVLATKANVANNQCDKIIAIHHTDDNVVFEKCDLLIANILANPLVELESTFSGLVKEGGSIVLSGILDEQLEMILEAYKGHFDGLEVQKKDEWCRVSGARNNK
ncbi:MAG: 50S ribosomal protein L11 methyltransferase [Gammaproteobacteria bacterium]